MIVRVKGLSPSESGKELGKDPELGSKGFEGLSSEERREGVCPLVLRMIGFWFSGSRKRGEGFRNAASMFFSWKEAWGGGDFCIGIYF